MQPLLMHANSLRSSCVEIAEVALVKHAGVIVLHVMVQRIKGLQVVSTHLTRKEWSAIEVKFLVFL